MPRRLPAFEELMSRNVSGLGSSSTAIPSNASAAPSLFSVSIEYNITLKEECHTQEQKESTFKGHGSAGSTLELSLGDQLVPVVDLQHVFVQALSSAAEWVRESGESAVWSEDDLPSSDEQEDSDHSESS